MNEIHATTRQLLAYRDGRPLDASEACHVASCERCRQRLNQLAQAQAALSALEDPEPDMRLWKHICDQQHAGSPRRGLSGWQLALAASITIFATTIVVSLTLPEIQAWQATAPASQVSTGEPSAATGDIAINEGQLSVARLRQRSRALENMLTRLGPEPSVRTVRDTTAVESLQASIALIDYQLSLPAEQLTSEERRELWQQRVDLMESLVTVRVAADRRNSI